MIQVSTSSSVTPVESVDGLGLTGSSIGEGRKRHTSNAKGGTSVTRVLTDAGAGTMETETPEVSANIQLARNFCWCKILWSFLQKKIFVFYNFAPALDPARLHTSLVQSYNL